MSAPDHFIRNINALNVPASLLGEVMIVWASLPPEGVATTNQAGMSCPIRLRRNPHFTCNKSETFSSCEAPEVASRSG